MKNLMSLPAFLFLLQLVLHPICHCKVMFPMDANLIAQTCRKTPNYNLCVSSLKSDPRSESADVRGLALIMVNVVKAKATTTLNRINELLKKTPRDASLNDCHHMYITILQADIVEANEAITLGDPKFAEESMNDAGIEAENCENNLKRRYALTHLNKDVTNVSGVAAAIEMKGNYRQMYVQVTFGISDFQKAQVLDPSWTDPQILCRKKGASVEGGLGPFGLLVLASKGLQEYTAVFFRIFKAHNHKYNNKYLVLMCSDQSQSSLNIEKKLDKSTYGVFLNLDPLHETLALRSLIDHSIIESFGGGGKACISQPEFTLYWLLMLMPASIYAFNYGNESVEIRGNAWNLRTAKIN